MRNKLKNIAKSNFLQKYKYVQETISNTKHISLLRDKETKAYTFGSV
jgi:hypothetical protein